MDEQELTACVEVPWITSSFDFGDNLNVWVGSFRDVFDSVPSFLEFPASSALSIID